MHGHCLCVKILLLVCMIISIEQPRYEEIDKRHLVKMWLKFITL